MARRVVMVGLEALDLLLFEELMRAGELPSLALFAASAQRAGVTSDGDVLSGSVWATFGAGAGPGSHGVYYAHHWVPVAGRYAAEGSTPWHYKPFWARLAGSGRRALILDVPDAPLVRIPEVDACYGWGPAHDIAPTSHPASFLRDIERRFGKLPLGPDTVEPLDGRAKLRLARKSAASIGRRAEALRLLLASRRYDLCLAVFPEMHTAGHYLATPEPLTEQTSSREALAHVLRRFDRAWPGIVEAAGEESDIFLFSPHGLTAGAMTGAFADRLVERFLGRAARPPSGDLASRVAAALPAGARHRLWRALPQSIRDRRQTPRDGRGQPLFPVLHDPHASFRARIAGRERDGQLSEGEANALLDRLRDFLAAATDASGRPAFARTWRAAHDAPGPQSAMLPDVVGVTDPAFGPPGIIIAGGEVVSRPRATVHSGTHTAEGYLLFRPGRGGGRVTAGAVDNRGFAATALSRLDLPSTGFEEGSFIA